MAAAATSRSAAAAGSAGPSVSGPPPSELEARMALLDRLEMLEMMQAEEARVEAEMLAAQGDDAIVVSGPPVFSFAL